MQAELKAKYEALAVRMAEFNLHRTFWEEVPRHNNGWYCVERGQWRNRTDAIRLMQQRTTRATTQSEMSEVVRGQPCSRRYVAMNVCESIPRMFIHNKKGRIVEIIDKRICDYWRKRIGYQRTLEVSDTRLLNEILTFKRLNPLDNPKTLEMLKSVELEYPGIKLEGLTPDEAIMTVSAGMNVSSSTATWHNY